MILVGALAGFTSGLFGVGGGVVIVPALVLLAGFGQRMAHGTSLTAIAPISIAGVIGYGVADEVEWTVAGLVAVGAVAGATVGTRWLGSVSQPALQIGFAGVLLVTAAGLVTDTPPDAAPQALHALTGMGYVILGVGAGVLAGLMGVGGGVIIVPVLTIAFGLPLAIAKGTSLAVIVPTAIMGTQRNVRHGHTRLRPGLLVGAAGVASALVASQISLALDARVSSLSFAVLLLFVAVRLTVIGFRERQARGSGTTLVG